MQLEERVAGLEKSGRRWRAAAVVLGVAFTAAVFRGAGNAPLVADEIKTHLLRVYDDKGQVVFFVGSSADRTSLEIRRNNQSAFGFQAEDGANIFAVEKPGGGDPQVLISADGKGAYATFEPTKGANTGSTTSVGSLKGAGFIQIRGGNGRKVFEKP